MKNQILNVKSYQQVVQFAADLVAPTARKQWYSLPRTDWYSFPRNEWYSLTRILHLRRLLALYVDTVLIRSQNIVANLKRNGILIRIHVNPVARIGIALLAANHIVGNYVTYAICSP